jgi:hypothetical protein
MLTPFAKIVVNSKIRKENLMRQKKFVPWENIERIALIIHQEDRVNKSAIDKFVNDTKKYVEVFYIETRSKQPTYGDWNCLSKKDVSFLNLPKKTLETQLKNKNFDVVINTCKDNDLFSASVCSSLQAFLKCAGSSHLSEADLIIRKTEPFDLIYYLHDIVKYLKMIRV